MTDTGLRSGGVYGMRSSEVRLATILIPRSFARIFEDLMTPRGRSLRSQTAMSRTPTRKSCPRTACLWPDPRGSVRPV
jgi:hypothetical protein